MNQADALVQLQDTLASTADSIVNPEVLRSLTYTAFSVRDLFFVLIFGCFILSCYVLSLNKKTLWERLNSLFQMGKSIASFTPESMSKRRSPSFQYGSRRNPSQTGGASDFLVLLYIQAGILIGLCGAYCILGADINSGLDQKSFLYVVAGIATAIVYLLLKVALYKGIGWFFLEPEVLRLAISSFSTLIYVLALLLLPLALVCIYLPVAPSDAISIFVWVLAGFKILLILLWLKLFCRNIYGCLPIILYFCALEMIPMLLLWLGIDSMNLFS